MADVEHYARGDFLADLIKGMADTEATTRLADKVAALDRNRSGGESPAGRSFRRDGIPSGIRPQDGKVTGRYDASVMGLDPQPDSSFYHFKRSVRRTAARAA